MADNILVNTGTGATIATDQIGTAHYQVVKIAIGGSNTATALANGQQTMTNSIPMVLATDQSSIPVTITGTTGVISISGTPTMAVATIATGSISIINTPVITATISNNPLICTAANVTIASITTGTISVINTPVVTATISNTILTIRASAPATPVSAYAVATTATGTILLTSGGHTIYITDLLFSVDVPMNVTWNSATTAKGIVYLATKGGFALSLNTPLILTSAQSLTFTPSASGSCAGFMAGYTVT